MLFDRFDLVMQAATETVFGEMFLLTPRRRPADINKGFEPDPDRQFQAVTGIYVERDVTTNITDAWDIRSDKRPGASFHEHNIDIDPRTNFGCDIRTGDILVRIKDQSQWVAVSPNQDTAGRLIVKVERLV